MELVLEEFPEARPCRIKPKSKVVHLRERNSGKTLCGCRLDVAVSLLIVLHDVTCERCIRVRDSEARVKRLT